MRWGRSRRHDLPELVRAPKVDDLPPAKLQAGGRYFGTAISGAGGERVVARGLGARSNARISLSAEALDVIRLAGSFRIPADALRGARRGQGIGGGKAVPPDGLLVVTWQHGDYRLETGFRLNNTSAYDGWVRSIGKIVKESTS